MGKPVLPLLLLDSGVVLLPGATLEIPIGQQHGVSAILGTLFQAKHGKDSSLLTFGCVPRLPAEHAAPFANSDQGHRSSEDSSKEIDSQVWNGYHYGTVAEIKLLYEPTPSCPILVVSGTRRFRVDEIVQQKPCLLAKVSYEEYDQKVPALSETDFDEFKRLTFEYLKLISAVSVPDRPAGVSSALVTQQMKSFVAQNSEDKAAGLIDLVASLMPLTFEQKIGVLSAMTLTDRVSRVMKLLVHEIEHLRQNHNFTRIQDRFNSEPGMNDTVTPSFQIILQRPISTSRSRFTSNVARKGQSAADEIESDEITALERKLNAAALPADAQKMVRREVQRLRRINPAQSDHAITRTYLETIADLPWTKSTPDCLDAGVLQRAQKQLDHDHSGLGKVKRRLIEHLAVLRMRRSRQLDLEAQHKNFSHDTNDGNALPSSSETKKMPTNPQSSIEPTTPVRNEGRAPILLLVGPPGTGKTSLAKSMARALDRKFHRISLGGVRDEAEIRGHRRTYVAAMPGLILAGLRKVGTKNPVFLLDEIDKVSTGHRHHGDPSAALLEVLDPEQNHTFGDHYLNIPFDLSQVMFIATANSTDTIPDPLLDRMELIQLEGYTSVEKRDIAVRHLIPKQAALNGLRAADIDFQSKAIDAIIVEYTREAGVRNLEREIGSICRHVAVKILDKEAPSAATHTIGPGDLEAILGVPRYDQEVAARDTLSGVVTGLVAYGSGGQGSILFIELVDMPGVGKVQLTGRLGDVLKESTEVALSWVKAHSYELGLADHQGVDIMAHRNVHVHCPEGAVPKDGPSAGLAHVIAFISLFSGRTISPRTAMTGEISLRGKVLPVGGFTGKLIGAHRASIDTVILPERNRRDLENVPAEVRNDIHLVFVNHVWDAVNVIWPELAPQKKQAPFIESRL